LPMTRLFAALLSLFLLSGCPGSIALSDLAGFGAVGSAVWLDIESKDGDQVHYLVLTNVGGYCGKVSSVADDVNGILADYASDLISNPFDACGRGDDVYEELTPLVDNLYVEDAKFLFIALGDGGPYAEPDTNTYEPGEDPSFSFSMYYLDGAPFATAADDWNSTLCGADIIGEVDRDWQRWDDGAPAELELEVNKNKTAVGTLIADIEKPNGDTEGDIEAKFSAPRCEIELSDDTIHFPAPFPFATPVPLVF